MIERELVVCGLMSVCTGSFVLGWVAVARWITSQERGIQIWDAREPDPTKWPKHKPRKPSGGDRN